MSGGCVCVCEGDCVVCVVCALSCVLCGAYSRMLCVCRAVALCALWGWDVARGYCYCVLATL